MDGPSPVRGSGEGRGAPAAPDVWAVGPLRVPPAGVEALGHGVAGRGAAAVLAVSGVPTPPAADERPRRPSAARRPARPCTAPATPATEGLTRRLSPPLRTAPQDGPSLPPSLPRLPGPRPLLCRKGWGGVQTRPQGDRGYPGGEGRAPPWARGRDIELWEAGPGVGHWAGPGS